MSTKQDISVCRVGDIFGRFCALMVLALLAALFMACQPATPSTIPSTTPTNTPSATPSTITPTTPSQPASQPPPATTSPGVPWVADGVITPGEYPNHNVYGDFEIYWLNDDQYVYIGMMAKTSGWIAIGFGPETMMKNLDIIEGIVTDSKLTISDQFSSGNFGPHLPDTQLGGTDDILASGGKVDNGYTTIEFKRKLDTGDKYDKPLVKGKNKIAWAIGGSDLTKHHMSVGYGEIDIK